MSPACFTACNPDSRDSTGNQSDAAGSTAAYTREHYKSLIDAVPGAVLLLDHHGIVVSANATAIEWLDEPIIGEIWRDIYQRDLSQELVRGELATRDKRLLNIATRPLGDQPGQVVLLSDVTESRALQEVVDRNIRLAAMGEMTARL